jgi:cytochrome c oxidase subunit 1
VLNSKRLILSHLWFAFASFGVALLLGAWQMYIRSPLHPWLQDPEIYYRSVTAHGSAMAYVFPTLISMGFGYAVIELSLKKTIVGHRWAWAGFILVVIGTATAMTPVAMGLASVLYTFYPPMIGSAFYYIGLVLIVVGSWIWVTLMAVNLAVWKREHRGEPVPLPMFISMASAYLWGWRSCSRFYRWRSVFGQR